MPKGIPNPKPATTTTEQYPDDEAKRPSEKPTQQAGAVFLDRSILDTVAVSHNLVKLHFGPMEPDLEEIEKLKRLTELIEAMAQAIVNTAPNCHARAQGLIRLSEARWWTEQAILTKGR